MINKMTDIAIEAGKMVEKGFLSEKHVKYKGAVDLVTEYDVAVEEFLKEKMSALFPNYKIIAEESADKEETDKGNVIYIDPIDGTTNFVHGFPFVSISIGVYNGSEGQFGVVYNPVIKEMFTSVKGEGSFLNGKEIKVSRTGVLEKSLAATGFPYEKDNLPRLMRVLEQVLLRTRGIRRVGSSALDLCYVAKGVFDLYYETKLKPWDFAAGAMILREAGGLVTNLEGLYHELNHHTVIASNGLIHKEFMQMLTEVD